MAGLGASVVQPSALPLSQVQLLPHEQVSKIQNETDVYRLEQDAGTAKTRAEMKAGVEILQNKAEADVKIKRSRLEQETRLAAIGEGGSGSSLPCPFLP